MSPALTTIGFDADDTLWQNERFYRLTEGKFLDLIDEHGKRDVLASRLLEAEKRNLALYGFGIKGFTLSMIDRLSLAPTRYGWACGVPSPG